MRLRKFDQLDEIADEGPTDDTQHYPDPRALENPESFDAYVLATFYGPSHPQAEPQPNSTLENEEDNQLTTDTDECNNEPPRTDLRHTQRTPHIQPRHHTS